MVKETDYYIVFKKSITLKCVATFIKPKPASKTAVKVFLIHIISSAQMTKCWAHIPIDSLLLACHENQSHQNVFTVYSID